MFVHVPFVLSLFRGVLQKRAVETQGVRKGDEVDPAHAKGLVRLEE